VTKHPEGIAKSKDLNLPGYDLNRVVRHWLPKEPLQIGSGVTEYEWHDYRREKDFRSPSAGIPRFSTVQ